MIEGVVKLCALYVLIGGFCKLTDRTLLGFVRYFFWIGIFLIIAGGLIPPLTRLTTDIHNVSVKYTTGVETVHNGIDAITSIPDKIDSIPYIGNTGASKYPPALTLKEKLLPFNAKFFIYPVSGNITKAFDIKSEGKHHGLDIGCDEGSVIKASRAGIVSEIGEHPIYGYFILLDHGEGWQTLYAHLSKFGVTKGQKVFDNDAIALSGGKKGAVGAGNSEGPHLHFEIRAGGSAVDPSKYLRR